MRRHPRAGVRDRWVAALLAANIGRPCLLLMLLLAHKMGDHGKVSIRREDPAAMLRVHPQRIAERIAEARAAGLLDLVEGSGVRGQVAQYVACVPDSGTQYVPDSGTHSDAIRYGPAVRTSGTHLTDDSGTAYRTAVLTTRARVTNARRKHDDNERDVRVSPTSTSPKDGSDEEVGRHSLIAAASPGPQRSVPHLCPLHPNCPTTTDGRCPLCILAGIQTTKEIA